MRQGRKQFLLEVKSVTLFHNRAAMFHDAVTERLRIGVLAGSIFSALLGYLILRAVLPERRSLDAPNLTRRLNSGLQHCCPP